MAYPINTFLDIYTEVITRFDTAVLSSVKSWVNQAELEVWGSAEWQFKKRNAVPVSVVGGRQQIGLATDPNPMPLDFMYVDRLYNAQGDRLSGLPEDVFDDRYQPYVAQGISQYPEAFKVVDDGIYLGPPPSNSDIYQLAYSRVLSSKTGAGAVQIGPMTLDTDTPYWPRHRMVLVWGAMRIGQKVESDLSYISVEDLYTKALDAMIDDLEVDEGGMNREFGADTLGSGYTAGYGG